MTIPELIAGAAESFADRLAIVDGPIQLTYSELHESALAFGAALVASGVEPGDRVAILAPNSLRWVVAFLGLSNAGAALVPVNTRFKGPEAAEILARSGARVLVTVTDFLETDYVAGLRDCDRALPTLRSIVVAHGPAVEGTESWTDFVGRAETATLREIDRRAVAVTDADVSDILFTSGTTGAPKGVVQTHASTLRVARDWATMTGLSVNDRYLMVNPYFHMFGLKAGILASVAAGAGMFPEPVFEVDRVLRRIGDEQITVLPGPPTLYQSILDHSDRAKYDLGSLRLAVTGAAEIPVELIRRMIDELPFRSVIAGYGLTEGGTATATDPGDDVETIARTVGRLRPGFELRIVNGDAAEVPVGEQGEILLRSGSVMSHYLDAPEATAEALSPDGWLRTGDLGVVDPGGNLRIVGRAKDMFIVGGFNAYPAEIENALLRHPDVRQVAVIGITHHRLGEIGLAFVVRREGSTFSADDLRAWSRQQMANYKVPGRIEFVDALPLNATGKVMKDVLRAQVAP